LLTQKSNKKGPPQSEKEVTDSYSAECFGVWASEKIALRKSGGKE